MWVFARLMHVFLWLFLIPTRPRFYPPFSGRAAAGSRSEQNGSLSLCAWLCPCALRACARAWPFSRSLHSHPELIHPLISALLRRRSQFGVTEALKRAPHGSQPHGTAKHVDKWPWPLPWLPFLPCSIDCRTISASP